ncbi:adaptor protein MecA [Streptococcus downei]|uniref:Adapter protein MecA n=1 Tax=Streptococcus downei MFe28 TaxID=764290 RepID=A0A380JBZ0_STRDO|nr:adaptor protein MecA [Streptococcus downei]EFQ57075.1 negative regulator of genetic competence (MecA) [Streptococcus downei F0415]SUN35588.1 adaptor protein [Streptococcus downei MFe28]
MEMKQINELTLKISVSLEDLDSYGMELKDFLMPQEKTEEFFYTILDELDIPDSFKSTGMLSFRVTPRKDRVDVFVTKSELGDNLDFEQLAQDMGDLSEMNPEDFFKNLEKNMMAHGDTEAHEKLKNLEAMLDDAISEFAPNDQPDTVSSEDDTDSQPFKFKEEDLIPVTSYTHYVADFPDLRSAIVAAKALAVPTEASELFKSEEGYHMAVLFNIEDEDKLRAKQLQAHLLEYGDPAKHTRAYLLEHAVKLLDHTALKQLRRIDLV